MDNETEGIIRPKTFSDEETMYLLTIFQQPSMQSKFTSNKRSHRHAWRAIATAMKELGYERSPEQCCYKFDNLKKKYYNIKKSFISEHTSSDWLYWDKFQQICGPNECITKGYMYESVLEPKEEVSASSRHVSTHSSPSGQSSDGEGSNQEAGTPSTNKDSYPTYAQKRYALKRKLSIGGSNKLLGFLKSSQKNDKQEQALIDVQKQEFLDATQDTKDYAVMCSSESKNKNKSFSIEETLNLLTIYQQPEMRSKFSKNKKSRMIAWRAVSRIMTELGFPRTPQQCMYRFSNLRKKYSNIKKALQAGEPKPKWPYWEEFEAIFEPRECGVAVYLDDAMLQPEDDMSASSPHASTLTPTREPGGAGDKINQAQGLTLERDVKNVDQLTTAFPQTNNQSTNKRTLEENVSELLDFLKESRKREEEAQSRMEVRNQELLEAVQNISHCIKVIADGLQGMKNTPMDYHVVK